jgi:hypothetical protein
MRGRGALGLVLIDLSAIGSTISGRIEVIG